MNYLGRKKHRDCANFILNKLFDKGPNHDLFLTYADWMDPNIPALSLDFIRSQTNKYDLNVMKRAIRKLLKNGHVTLVHTVDRVATLILTLEGRDAFLDEYYSTLNKKDFLESFELWAKWILPLVSLAISIVALVEAISKN
jgi:hypothetical protein